MFENMTKTRMYAFLSGMFCGLVIISNILATKTLEIGFVVLPCSILTFPALFIINDILSEIYGFKMTKRVIYYGFTLIFFAMIVYSIAMALPSNSTNAEAFSTILGTTPRLFIAGIIAYIVSNIVNSKVLVRLKERYYNLLFVRCILSTAIGEAIDSVVFISVSFIGVFSIDVILNMICCQVFFKVLYEFLIYPVTRKVIFYVRNLDDGELEIEFNANNHFE